MMAAEGEQVNAEKLAQAFVDLAETLVEDFDVHDLLHVLVRNCTDLLSVSAAGLLFADHGGLRVAVSSSESARLLELFQLQNDEGPCLEAYRTGNPVAAGNTVHMRGRWPRFAAAAGAEGFVSVVALPMRMRGQVIGTLNLFGDRTSPGITEEDLQVAQAMADVGTITILQDRLARHHEILAEQLQSALDSRVVIEQAKGVLSAHFGVGMEDAFQILRAHARDSRSRLADVAHQVVRGDWTGYRSD
jgi:GAF domain-containing protein